MEIGSRHSKYELVLSDMEKRILNGFFKHGDLLPSEGELAKYYEVGRNTVRRALVELYAKGLLSKRQGKLSRVERPSPGPVAMKRLALLNYFNYGHISENIIFFDVLQHLSFFCSMKGVILDFITVNRNSPCQRLLDSVGEYIGFIALGLSGAELEQDLIDVVKALPNMVAVDCDIGDVMFSVDSGNYDGGRMAADYMLEKGYGNIRLLIPNTHYKGAFYRTKGFMNEMKSHGVSLDASVVINAADCVFKGQNAIPRIDYDRIIAMIDGADAVFALSDQLALDLMLAVQQHGMKVPEDIAIMGFDGTYQSQHGLQRLTTICQNTSGIAEAALRIVLKCHAMPGCGPEHVSIPCSLLRGCSTL